VGAPNLKSTRAYRPHGRLPVPLAAPGASVAPLDERPRPKTRSPPLTSGGARRLPREEIHEREVRTGLQAAARSSP
jgi:hypothetical protein